MEAPALAVCSEICFRVIILNKEMSEITVILHKVQSLPVLDVRSDIYVYSYMDCGTSNNIISS